MKKVIAAAAAFAMVAGIASVASAAVDLSGSARARFIYQDGYSLVGDNYDNYDETKWDSRVRVQFKAESKGGAYAHARLRMIDTGWDGQDNYYAANGGDNNVWVDYAYLGVPLGNGWKMQAGNMPINFSRWFTFDERADRAALMYGTKGLKFAVTYDKASEGAAAPADDDDKNKIGIKVIKDLNDNLKGGLRAVYVADNTSKDMTGMVGSAYLTGKVAGGTVHAELAYKAGDTLGADLLGNDDAGIGGYVSWSGKMGSMTPDFRLGFTKDGYQADNDFGWIMIGYAEPITAWSKVGQAASEAVIDVVEAELAVELDVENVTLTSAQKAADTIFVSASNTFQLSEKTSLTANIVYMDVDGFVDIADNTALELSAVLAYQVSEGAVLSFSAGMLDEDVRDDKVIGAYGKLEISY